MSKQVTEKELIEIRSIAVDRFNRLPPHAHVVGGSGKPLDTHNQMVVAWLEAVFTVLNRKGAIKEDWLGPDKSLVAIETPTNGVVVDDEFGFDMATTAKKQKPKRP